MNRRTFLTSALAAGIATALHAQGKKPARILLRSSWQTVNIGDIAHTPGMLALLEKHRPEAEVTLWPSSVDRGVEEILRARFPKLKIAKTQAERETALAECDFFLHGSGPLLVGLAELKLAQKAGKPYGIGGVTMNDGEIKAQRELLAGAKFVFLRDTDSMRAVQASGITGPQIGFGPDATFAIDPRDDTAAAALLKENKLESGKFLCAIPRLRWTPYWEIHPETTKPNPERIKVNEEFAETDHAKLREGIIAWVRETKMRVLLTPEMTYEVPLLRTLIYEKLPADVRPIRHPLPIRAASFVAASGLAFLLGMRIAGAAAAPAADPAALKFFEKEVRPLLAEHCYKCHGEKKQKGGLRLDHVSHWLAGGEHGPAIVAGKPEASLVIKAVSRIDPDLEMPPDEKLTDNQIATLKKWIAMGAPWPEGETPARTGRTPGVITVEDRQWWGFQPVRRPVLPTNTAAHPVDAFVADRLRREGLTAAPPADRAEWVRRAYFDLHGLPPTPEEAKAFLEDAAPGAEERLIDRLLASPRHGERWAQHWLDLVRYADSDGYRAPPGFGSVPARESTTTPLQALLFVNGEWPLRRSRAMAERLMAQTSTNDSALVSRAWQLALGRAPSPAEQRKAETFLRQQRAEIIRHAPPPVAFREPLADAAKYFGASPATRLPAKTFFLQPGSPHEKLRVPLAGGTESDGLAVEAIVHLQAIASDASVRTVASRWNSSKTERGWALGVTGAKSRFEPGSLVLEISGDDFQGSLLYAKNPRAATRWKSSPTAPGPCSPLPLKPAGAGKAPPLRRPPPPKRRWKPSLELAFRMQAEAPEAVDLRAETEATKKLYGLDKPATAAFGRNCLLARRLVERTSTKATSPARSPPKRDPMNRRAFLRHTAADSGALPLIP